MVAIMQLIWTACAIALLCMWVTTQVLLVERFGILELWRSAAFILLVPVLFQIEGLELAVNYLRGRLPKNLTAAAIRELRRVLSDHVQFFAERQVFVVVIIVILTLASDVPFVYMPGYGMISRETAPFAFNCAALVWVTLPVLWLAQIPAKLLALHDAARFYQQSWFACLAIRIVAKLRLTSPALFVFTALRLVLAYPACRQDVRPAVKPIWDPIDEIWLIVPVSDHLRAHEHTSDVNPGQAA